MTTEDKQALFAEAELKPLFQVRTRGFVRTPEGDVVEIVPDQVLPGVVVEPDAVYVYDGDGARRLAGSTLTGCGFTRPGSST